MTTPETKYAVDLSNDGVSLWHRDAGRTWKLLGKVALSDKNFSNNIEKLKTGQTPDANGKFIVQVRVPRSEVFVSDIDLNGVKPVEIPDKINAFLTRNTPYAADDLVFDLAGKPDRSATYIAAISKETILEAKEFITGYSFEAAYYTTKLDKIDFPRNPRFYDTDSPILAPAPTPQKTLAENSDDIAVPAPPLPSVKTTPAPQDTKPLTANDTTDLSNFATVRSKTLKAPIQPAPARKPNRPSPPPEIPRRISIEMPAAIATSEPAKDSAPQKVARAITPLKMPQSKVIQTDIRGWLKPRYLMAAAALILLGVMYWFYNTLIDGKDEITSLQQISDTPPLIITLPKSMEQQISVDDAPMLTESLVSRSSQKPGMDAPAPLATPAPLEINKDTAQFTTAKNPEKQPETTGLPLETPTNPLQDPVATALITKPLSPEVIVPVVPAAKEIANAAPLIPTQEGTPGPEGITLFAGQPDFPPPLREQLKITPDPLKDILPKMRSKEFEENNKSEASLRTNSQVATLETDTPTNSDTLETSPIVDNTPPGAIPNTPDILALANPALKNKLPRSRPASIFQIAIEQKNSLLTRADPALADSKPKRRPATLKVPAANIPVTVQQVANDTAKPRVRPRSLAKTVVKAKGNIATASLTPSVAGKPSPVNIQKEATERSRFSKRRISLIGVYGSASNRRALVRMPSGRYVKVKPGQRFSGWKVAAIGESTVRITKGSRNQVLRMPK